MSTNSKQRPTILHTVGSIGNDRLFKLSILYASAFKDVGQFNFQYVAIFPNGEISNAQSLK